MKIFRLVLLVLSVLAINVRAQDEVAQSVPALNFHNAIAICQVPNNPLYNGLYKLGGHVFTQERRNEYLNVNNEWEVLLTAKALWSPRIFNTRIMAPDRLVGEINLVIGHNQGQVFCHLTTKPFQK